MKIKTLEKTNIGIVMSFLLPGLTGFLLFVFFPMLTTAGVAFTNYSGSPNWHFVGLKNFTRLFVSISFVKSLWLTLKFSAITLFLQIFLGLFFAVVLNRQMKGTNFFRSLFFMPNVLSAVGISLSFSLIFHPQSGVANQFLELFGLPACPWLTHSSTSLMSIIIVTIWMTFGYYMVIFLGGLQSINKTLYEAASIDGAGPFYTFFKITLPMLSPTMFFAMTMSIINCFKVFDQVFMMTGGQFGGGPAESTNVIVYDIYRNSFGHYEFGYASAEALILLSIIMGITIFQYRNQKKWVTYDI